MAPIRQLAAILFADIMGFTALMGDDEELALSLREKLKGKLEAEAREHNGRIVKFMGDGALCSFTSASEAVRAAIAVQRVMLQEPKVPVRIGIHQADVVFEEADVHGDGVNIASRLESLAVPGSILISSKVVDDIKNQKDIQAVSLGLYSLKNVREPMEIFAISNPGLEVPVGKELQGKAEKYKEQKPVRKRILTASKIGIPLVIIALAAWLIVTPWLKKQDARYELMPAIQDELSLNYIPSVKAFDLAREAKQIIPDDSLLTDLWQTIATTITIETDPPGAELFWKDYTSPDAEWRSAGITPLVDVQLPRAYLRMEFRKQGYQTLEYAGPGFLSNLKPDLTHLKLDATGSIPEQMARIPEWTVYFDLPSLQNVQGKVVPEFLMDKYEVTNSQYKAFVDAGGYTNPAYWAEPILMDGKEISLEEAVKLFVDRTGRPGPAGWEGGTYPEGLENHPVTGVSWYEAAAYAVYVHKKLPTIYEWSRTAATARTEFMVPLSNFNGVSTVEVGSLPGYSTFGLYDMAGNAREWCSNATGSNDQRFVLGGGWNDPSYAFNDSYTQNALDRSVSNGFRCVKELQDDPDRFGLNQSIHGDYRDYRKEKPVDNATFSIYLNQFAYDKDPLNARVEASYDREFWTIEKISFDAGYGDERMEAYVYLPKNFKPPYQTILLFPGSNALYTSEYNVDSYIGWYDFFLKSGRAYVEPIFKSTYNRRDKLNSRLPQETVQYKDHVIMWRKDLGRAIDYLETRPDIDTDKLAFYGISWGGFVGGILPAVEKRIKVVMLNVGGMAMTKTFPEVDQINFLPRITQPVLMVNGKHDMYFPVESAQLPMFDLLGTPARDKKINIYDSGHLTPRIEVMKATLNWLDHYFGPTDKLVNSSDNQ